jgi:hypothetical protein
VVTPQRDATIRRRAQRAYDFATAELALTDDPPIRYGVGDWEARREREKAWHATAEYARLREYRSWLYDVKHYAEYRRRHPIVRLIRRSRSIGRVERGEYDEPTSRFHWHWQNLDEDRAVPARSPAIGALGLPTLSHEGRAWFYWYVRATDRRPLKIEVDWAFGRRVWSSGGSYSRKNSGTIALHASLRPVASVYLIVKHVWPRRVDQPSRTYSLSIVDGTLHWDFGKPGSDDEWHRDDPLNWMRGCRFLLDDIFGRDVCTTENVGPPVQALACFPEGRYTLTLQRQVWTWTRPRWPWPYVRRSVDITLERPPEFQGKGENSYDCGPDAIYGMSSDGHGYEDAVAAYVKAVLRERAKRGHLGPEHRTVLTEARP